MDKTVLISIVSASSALAGVLVSQFAVLLKEHLNQKHHKNVLLREKYEQLMDCIQESLIWSVEAGECKNMDEIIKYSVNIPARKALSLSLIYFPEFQDACADFQNNYVAHYEVLIKSYRSDISYGFGTQAAAHNRKAFEKTSGNIALARQNLDDLIVLYSRKYARA
ncbi:hypothetical protein [Aliivibrio fischeri]|uniref:hypothetical protein n=1 Tax=Aliivibrio fischeri TaxID=668 RepID=UPI00080DB89D|nr:hypothetical protein [Aliivibrio fischeri]MUK26585.1 hypothetical protein [Aliivibrio fischeri]MUK33305.1 hypothetical protein [Aliivibrio fischeri]OCH03234.1 hypothetical protein A6E10_15465 [Aliivibrio fischeri]OCH59070.1 hypothetical protein A6D98_15225 [Aliivibrio fischeri]